MPLEGISSSGQLIPNAQIAEAASLGAFDAKVEHSAPIKKPEDNEGTKKETNDENEEGGNTATGHYTKGDSGVEETLLPKSGSKDKRFAEYTIKFNKYTELVELISLKTGNVIQTISPNDLIALVSELKYTSGIFVDNEI